MAQRIGGEQGGDLVLYNEFIYKKKKGKGQKDYYQCNDNGCLVTLHTLRNTLTVVQNAGVHTHNPPGDIVASTTVFEEAKRRIDADPTRHLPRLWEVLNWYDQQYQNGLILPDLNEFRFNRLLTVWPGLYGKIKPEESKCSPSLYYHILLILLVSKNR